MSIKHLSAFAGVYLIWGTTYLVIVFAIATIPPFLSAGVRFLFAGALLYAWLLWRQKGRPFAGLNTRDMIICGVLMPGLGNGLVVWAQQGVPSGIAALTVAAVPILVPTFDWLFFSRRAPNKQAALGILLALAGVVTIILTTHSLSGATRPAHLVALVAAVIAWSVGSLVMRRNLVADKVLNASGLQMFAGGVFLLALSGVTGEWLQFDPGAVTASSVWAVLYLAIFGSIVAMSCYLWLLSHVSAQQATTYALVNPVVALLLGAAILNESLEWQTLVAAIFVLAGIALVLFQKPAVELSSRNAAAAPAPGTKERRSAP